MRKRQSIRMHGLNGSSSSANAERVDWKAEYWRLVSVEGELEASRERYAALYDSAPVGYATLDRHGWIKEINLTGARILGRSRATLIGGTLASLITRPDQRKFLRH